MKSVLFNHRGFGYVPATLLLAIMAGCGSTSGPGPGTGGGSGVNVDPGPTAGPSTVVGGGDSDATIGEKGAGLPVSKNCESCHKSIFKEWSTSAHARALASVATVAENNGLFLSELQRTSGPDPRQFCVNCHSPIVTGAVLSKQGANGDARLPFNDPNIPQTALAEGVGCTTCHSYIGTPEKAVAGLAVYQNDFDLSGTFYGPFDNAAKTSAHKTQALPTFGSKSAQELCITCHNVFYVENGKNRNIDDAIVGQDLVLQNTSAEFDKYFAQGGTKTCLDCHMPVRAGVTRVAEGAMIGTPAQETAAPSRTVRSHKFVGVDYPLDGSDDETAGDRLEMLQTGINFNIANLKFANNVLTFDTVLKNNETGHNFPTGFAFARQTFIEVIITDFTGRFLDGSGRLIRENDDLCDKTTFDSGLGQSLRGCVKADLQLVNLQLQLVSNILPGKDDAGNDVAVIDPVLGKETVIQNLDGGAVIRRRPIDNKELKPLEPNETRSYKYSFKVNGDGQALKLSVRLRMRNLPPYFLRALQGLAPAQKDELTKAIANLKVFNIATITQEIKNQ